MRLHYTETQRLLIAVATLWAIMLLGGDCGRDKTPGLDAADSAAVSTLNANDSREQTGTTSAAVVSLPAVSSCRVSNSEDSRPPSEIAWITMLGQGWPMAVSPDAVEGRDLFAMSSVPETRPAIASASDAAASAPATPRWLGRGGNARQIRAAAMPSADMGVEGSRFSRESAGGNDDSESKVSIEPSDARSRQPKREISRVPTMLRQEHSRRSVVREIHAERSIDNVRGQSGGAGAVRARAVLLPRLHASAIARICAFEADRRVADCIAIWWVAVKRAGASDGDPHGDALAMLERYSTFARTHTARAERIRAEEPPAELVELAARLLAGEVADPCPHAMHWGGRGDSPHGRMVRARCSSKTANTFYALVKR